MFKREKIKHCIKCNSKPVIKYYINLHNNYSFRVMCSNTSCKESGDIEWQEKEKLGKDAISMWNWRQNPKRSIELDNKFRKGFVVIHEDDVEFCDYCMLWTTEPSCPKCGNSDLRYDATY